MKTPRPPIMGEQEVSAAAGLSDSPIIGGWGAILALALLLLLAAPPAARAAPPPALVNVDTDTVLVPRYTGPGVQWDPADYAFTEAQWQRVFRRVDALHPAFIRCCLSPSFYCTGFDARKQPVYAWDSVPMARLYRILDYCQAHQVEVLLGEWGPGFGMALDDPRWSRLIGDCLTHLIRVRGYTCIKYYNKQNEPRGDSAVFVRWQKSQESLAATLRQKGLDRQVTLVGPDTSGTDLLWWVNASVDHLPGTLGVYEAHWYASDAEITQGMIETTLRRTRAYAAAHDPAGAAKPFWIAEAGTSDTRASVTGDWNSGDSNLKIRDFGYGVFMADYLVQTLRAGVGGVSVWDLDDAMHSQAKIAPTPDNPNAYNLKVWGFWNTLGGQMGRPEDEALRPWFYPWAVLCRAFPRGAKIVSASGTGLPGVRVAAALLPPGGFSLALVNDGDTPRSVRVAVPNAVGWTDFQQWSYFESDRPADAEGFPVPRRRLRGVSLRTGLTVDLPARGVVVLATPGGLPLAHGLQAPARLLSVGGRDGAASVAQGETLPLEAVSIPDNSRVRWSVTGAGGRPTPCASVTPAGLLTGRTPGTVRVTATAWNGATKSALIAVTRDKEVTDTLENWDKTYSHTDGLMFETVHPALFENSPSHLKRSRNTPETLTYHLPGLAAFTVRAYSVGPLANQVQAETSPDGILWTAAALVSDAPAPTADGWARVNLRPSRLPAGTNYLRLTLSGNAPIYSPQISRITLTARPSR